MTDYEFQQELRKFARRANYIDGLHVKANYPGLAHCWLIGQMVQAKEWRIILDEDGPLMTVFAPEIRRAEAYHFLCKIDRSKPGSKPSWNSVIAKKNCDCGALLVGTTTPLFGNSHGYAWNTCLRLTNVTNSTSDTDEPTADGQKSV